MGNRGGDFEPSLGEASELLAGYRSYRSVGPYMLVTSLLAVLWGSVGVTLVALFGFGYVKGRFTGITPLRGGLQTVFIGG